MLISPAGGEDPEWEPTLGGLQQELYDLLDEQRRDELREAHRTKQNWTDLRRLRELQDPTVSHDWLWALNPAHGPTVAAGDFSMGLRIRLGASLTCEECLFANAAAKQ